MLQYKDKAAFQSASDLFGIIYDVANALCAKDLFMVPPFRKLLVRFMFSSVNGSVRDATEAHAAIFDRNEDELIDYFLHYSDNNFTEEILMRMMQCAEINIDVVRPTRHNLFPYTKFFQDWINSELEPRRLSASNILDKLYAISALDNGGNDDADHTISIVMAKFLWAELYYVDVPLEMKLEYPQFTLRVIEAKADRFAIRSKTSALSRETIDVRVQQAFPDMMKQAVEQFPNFYVELALDLRNDIYITSIALSKGTEITILQNVPMVLQYELHNLVSSFLLRNPSSFRFISRELYLQYPDILEVGIKAHIKEGTSYYSRNSYYHLSEILVHGDDPIIWDILILKPDLVVDIIEYEPRYFQFFTTARTLQEHEELVIKVCRLALSKNPSLITRIPEDVLLRHMEFLDVLYDTNDLDTFQNLPKAILISLVRKGLQHNEIDHRRKTRG